MQLIKDIDLSDYMLETEVAHEVNPASTWVDGVVAHFHNPQVAPSLLLPFKKTHCTFHVRGGEVTLWAGINGHGKSMMTSQVAMHFCNYGELVCMASLEMPPTKTMARASRQCYGALEPTEKYIRDLFTWTDGKLWIYDHVGSIKPSLMLAVIRYAIDKFNITQFFVDNLMKVIAGEDNYNDQKDFVNNLCAIAKETGCHIHLVLHVKKLKDEETMPNKFDIKGSGAITDLVDNIFIVWRNKKKENMLRDNGDSYPDMPDAMLVLEKQRHAEEFDTGLFQLWFDNNSMQYTEDRHELPLHLNIQTVNYVEDF